ncbi:hypothetical protein F5Y05DRAFT_423948 [Hypoxylon sp. FL0543]|nr:hypothetical protein F5Y05DRAFT_423948 [Hypoxylon sp. FL0543]
MTEQGHFVANPAQPAGEEDDVVMMEADDEQYEPDDSGTINSSEALEDGEIRVQRIGRRFTVRLLRPEPYGLSPAGYAFESTQAVMLKVFGCVFPSDTVLILPNQHNRIILRKAFSYLIAKKNMLYLEFKRRYGLPMGVEDIDRDLYEYEETGYLIDTARTAVIQGGRSLIEFEMEDKPGSHFLPLLFMRFDAYGVSELYDPVEGRVQPDPIMVDGDNYEEEEDAIHLWECEETLNLLHHWDVLFDLNEELVNNQIPGHPMPSNQSLKKGREPESEDRMEKRQRFEGS